MTLFFIVFFSNPTGSFHHFSLHLAIPKKTFPIPTNKIGAPRGRKWFVGRKWAQTGNGLQVGRNIAKGLWDAPAMLAASTLFECSQRDPTYEKHRQKSRYFEKYMKSKFVVFLTIRVAKKQLGNNMAVSILYRDGKSPKPT